MHGIIYKYMALWDEYKDLSLLGWCSERNEIL